VSAIARRVESTGEWLIAGVRLMGEFFMLGVQLFRAGLRGHFPWRETLRQFDSLVVRSTAIVTVTALFTGMVLALQTVVSLTRFGAKPYTGSFVGLAFVLELGPVLTALMVSGRVGAGITAEIGSMAVTEQVDAIRAIGADPVQKLVLPRVLSLTLGLPMLTMLAYILGIFGGAVIAQQYGITSNFYLQTVINVVTIPDVFESLSKTLVFGWMIAMIGCFLGLRTTGGTVGVGRATTTAVVTASIGVLVSDFFLTKLLMMI
jgi:phospholipid/cholesterol/gamma-HCH transport system permease protein